MHSKRELESYLMIDHRLGEGISPEQAAKAGKETMPIGRGMLFETPTVNCSHCQRMIVLNPQRDRSRGYCPKCDRYVCDQCEAVRVQTGVCYPYRKKIEDLYEAAVKASS